MKANPKRVEKGLYWDRAWSIIEGCRPISEACENCWSAAQTHMRARQTNPAMANRYSGLIDEDTKHFNGKIRVMNCDLEKPCFVTKPKVWAIWNDLFHENVDWCFIDRVLATMAICPQHTFLLLTKRIRTAYHYFVDRPTHNYVHAIYRHIRPEIVASEQRPRSLPEDLSWPLANLYLGSTAENQTWADKRLDILIQIPAAIHFASIEPMLGPIELPWMPERHVKWDSVETRMHHDYRDRLDWVVCGGESGTKARPMHPDWPRSIRDQCQAAGVPFFFKQWGEWAGDVTHYDKKQHISKFWGNDDRGNILSYKVGKKKAGRLLDGRTWEEFPE